MSDNNIFNNAQKDDFEDFFENSLCGFLITNPDGEIIKVNARIAKWLECLPEDLIGKRFSNLLSVGSKIYYETHLSPLLRMQGYFNEIAAELVCKNDRRMPVFINGSEQKDSAGKPKLLRLIVIDASDRLTYEKNLRSAKSDAEHQLSNERHLSAIREQFIAVLGHDLRNPIQAISMGAEIMLRKAKDPIDARIAGTIKNSSARMIEMIENIMDFARARLGGGLIANLKLSDVKPSLINVVDELRISFPDRIIETQFNITSEIFCDVHRLSQLLSNLVANAITHGARDTPVIVIANADKQIFELSVINNGKSIPADSIIRLFEPFTRNEERPSRNGLGLGLYIASQIAKAHHGTLKATSSEKETSFTFRMHLT